MTPARGGGWDTGKVPLEICPDPSAHNLATPQPEAGLDAEQHGYTCGLCDWGRDSVHGEAAYQNHMAHVHPPQPKAGFREAVEDAIATLDHVESDLQHRRAALADELREPKP